jgi:hypothetical protein
MRSIIDLSASLSLRPVLRIFTPDHDDPEDIDRAYRQAAKKLHPDAGGSTADFQRLQEARRVLDGVRL